MKSRLLNFSAQRLLVAFLFIAQWQMLYVRLDTNRVSHAIESDGVGYYDYLLRTFITRDYPFSLSEHEKQGSSHTNTIYPVNKYFFGEAFSLLPFFLAADFLTQAIRPEMRDGFSSYYQISVAIAALFYLFLGLWMVIRLLRRMKYQEEVVNTILILLFLGTNLYYYALHEVSVSHVYSFALISFFLDQLQLQIQKQVTKRWLLLSFLLAWITLIRPVNIIIILALFTLAGSWKTVVKLLQNLLKKPGLVLSCLSIGFVFIGIQSAYYFLQSGSYWADSYGKNETFNFLDPQISNVLFSFRKGLFLYTPLLLLVFPGLWFYRKREGSFASIAWVVMLSLLICITSSWWYWAYGGSFGMRPIIDFYPFIIFPIAALTEAAYRKITGRIALTVVLILGVFLNLFQTWQYVEAIIPYELMTRSKYSHLFLQTKPHFKHIYPPDLTDKPFSEYKGRLLYSADSIADRDRIIQIVNLPGEQKKVELLRLSFQEIFKDTLIPPCWLEISGEFKLEDYSTDASIITAIDSNTNQPSWFWNRYFLIRSVDVENEWKFITVRIDLPEVKNPGNIFSVSIINDWKTTVQTRNVNLRLLSK